MPAKVSSRNFFREKLNLAVAYGQLFPTFELGFFDDIQDLDNVSEMVETSETSDKSKDQQLSESATEKINVQKHVKINVFWKTKSF